MAVVKVLQAAQSEPGLLAHMVAAAECEEEEQDSGELLQLKGSGDMQSNLTPAAAVPGLRLGMVRRH